MPAPSGFEPRLDEWDAAVTNALATLRGAARACRPEPTAAVHSPWQAETDFDLVLPTWEVAPLDGVVAGLPYPVYEEPLLASALGWDAPFLCEALCEPPRLLGAAPAGGGGRTPSSSMAVSVDPGLAVSKSRKRRLRRQLLHHELRHAALLQLPVQGAAVNASPSIRAEHCEAPRGAPFAQGIRGNVVRMALSKAGCRSLQDAFEAAARAEQEELVQELRGSVLTCAKHSLGSSFVLQKCIEELSPDALSFFGDELSGHAAELSAHPFGHRVVQRLLQCWPRSHVAALTEEVVASAESLARSRHGNLIVQDVLGMSVEPHCTHILAVIRKCLPELALHKFGSRIVERFLDPEPTESADGFGIAAGVRDSRRDAVLEGLLQRPGCQQPSLLFQLANDSIGNFVVQAVLKAARGDLRAEALRQLSDGRAKCDHDLSPHVTAALDRALAVDRGATHGDKA